jgi:hypothetical protein
LQTVFTRKFWKSRKRITTESILGALVKDAELRMLEKTNGPRTKMRELLSMNSTTYKMEDKRGLPVNTDHPKPLLFP